MNALRLLLPVLLLAAAPAFADPRDEVRDAWELFWAERRIENTMVLGHLRGIVARRAPAPDWTPRTAGKGRLERGPGGVPILYLEGTPEEMGTQHGTLMRREMKAMELYVRSFVGRHRMRSARKRAQRLFERHCPPEYLRELRALAAAAGVTERDLFLAQSFTDLYRGFGCSTLAAPSAEGTFLARNLDFPNQSFLERYSIVVVARPTGKQPYVSVSWPGLIGVLSGQNAHLAASVLVVHDEGDARSGLPFQLAFRRVLEEADSCDAAQALMETLPITVTNNLMLVDAAGESRCLELHPDGLVARRPKGERLVATNHFVSRELRRPRASFTMFSSRKRYRAVTKACPLDGEGPVSLSDAKRALGDAAIAFTVQSMVFLPREGAIEVAFATRTPVTKHGTFVRLRREDLLGN